MRRFFPLAGILACAGLVACGSAPTNESSASAASNASFLGDAASKLQDAKSPSGESVKRWISPTLVRGKYKSVLIDKSVFHPQPVPTEQVSGATLSAITNYYDEALKRELSSVIPIATEPGPTTLRFQPAITAAAPENAALKPYQLIPIALVVTMATRDKSVTLATEFKATDSSTNELMAAGARARIGREVKSSADRLTLDDFKPAIDVWAKDLRVQVQSLVLN
jgi:hypothetical protein